MKTTLVRYLSSTGRVLMLFGVGVGFPLLLSLTFSLIYGEDLRWVSVGLAACFACVPAALLLHQQVSFDAESGTIETGRFGAMRTISLSSDAKLVLERIECVSTGLDFSGLMSGEERRALEKNEPLFELSIRGARQHTVCLGSYSSQHAAEHVAESVAAILRVPRAKSFAQVR